MTWTALRWVWQLEAPLFIGMPPAGTLNRCRLYVPARVLWGAVTSELARLNGDEKFKFPDYGKFGKEVGENCRFTYLFPAEKTENKYVAWLPEYVGHDRKDEGEFGLRWCPYPQGNSKSLSDREFRQRLLCTRPGTAIAPETNSAFEGTLREMECINPWWHDSDNQGGSNATLLLGYVFLRNNGFRKQLDNINTLFIGGDTRYGLGKMHRARCPDVSDDLSVFERLAILNKEYPGIQSDVIWGHAPEDAVITQGIQGAKELLGGWEQGTPWKGARAWAPGSSAEQPLDWVIDSYGNWIQQ